MFYPLSSFYVRKKRRRRRRRMYRSNEKNDFDLHHMMSLNFFFVYILHTKNDDLHLHLQTRKWWPGSKCILCILIRSFVCVNERKSVWWIPSENVNVYNSHFVPGVLWWLAISISFFFGLNLHLEIFRSLFEWMKWINES